MYTIHNTKYTITVHALSVGDSVVLMLSSVVSSTFDQSVVSSVCTGSVVVVSIESVSVKDFRSYTRKDWLSFSQYISRAVLSCYDYEQIRRSEIKPLIVSAPVRCGIIAINLKLVIITFSYLLYFLRLKLVVVFAQVEGSVCLTSSPTTTLLP